MDREGLFRLEIRGQPIATAVSNDARVAVKLPAENIRGIYSTSPIRIQFKYRISRRSRVIYVESDIGRRPQIKRDLIRTGE